MSVDTSLFPVKVSSITSQTKASRLQLSLQRFRSTFRTLAPSMAVVLALQCPLASGISDIDLSVAPTTADPYMQVYGSVAADNMGISVAHAGDVNNDGYSDIVVGANLADVSSKADAGAAYLIFGQAGATVSTFDTASFTSATGIRILGPAATNYVGRSVSSLGDLNKDGFDDFVVGSTFFSPPSRANGGGSLVIFGKATASWADIDTSTDVTAAGVGFWIYGAVTGDFMGFSVGSAGDFNNDGNLDIIVGGYGVDRNTVSNVGGAYVILGQGAATTATNIDLSTFTSSSTTGFRVYGTTLNENCGWTVSGVGDINNDGFDDVLVGCQSSAYSGRTSAGSVFVLFGHDSTTPYIDLYLAVMTSAYGFVIYGANTNANMGFSVSKAGDVNADGMNDFVVGAYRTTLLTRTFCGAAYVIFGRSSGFSDIDTASFTSGSDGFRVIGAAGSDNLGRAVGGGEDVDGDGIDDIVVGASGADPPSRTGAGITYVILGHASSYTFTDIDAASLTSAQGTQILGAATSDASGTAVDVVPDFNGDGGPEVLVGASAADPPSRIGAGIAYLVYVVAEAGTTPTTAPTAGPTVDPSPSPSNAPTVGPTTGPTVDPTASPSNAPTVGPTAGPTVDPTTSPSNAPTVGPTAAPTPSPTPAPSVPQTEAPTQPTAAPTLSPTTAPTNSPSADPSAAPTAGPTLDPTLAPTAAPTVAPTPSPSESPTMSPSADPSTAPTTDPTQDPTLAPTAAPTVAPTPSPSESPTLSPSADPSTAPTADPTQDPTLAPTAAPTVAPTPSPSESPTMSPSAYPSTAPTASPTQDPTLAPSAAPTMVPTVDPSAEPTLAPTALPTFTPTAAPTLCEIGTYSSAESGSCAPCPIGTYSDQVGASACEDCSYPYGTASTGNSQCDTVQVGLSDVGTAALFGLTGVFVLSCLATQAASLTAAVVGMVMICTLDLLTDLVYIVSAKFVTGTVFGLCVAFFLLRAAPFMHRLYEMGHWYPCFRASFYSVPEWMSAGEGSPVTAALVLAMVLVYPLYLASHLAFAAAWLVFGCFLHLTGVMALQRVQEFWVQVWRGEWTAAYSASAATQAATLALPGPGTDLMLLAMFVALPEIILQLYNQEKVSYTAIGIISVIASGLVIVSGITAAAGTQVGGRSAPAVGSYELALSAAAAPADEPTAAPGDAAAISVVDEPVQLV